MEFYVDGEKRRGQPSRKRRMKPVLQIAREHVRIEERKLMQNQVQ